MFFTVTWCRVTHVSFFKLNACRVDAREYHNYIIQSHPDAKRKLHTQKLNLFKQEKHQQIFIHSINIIYKYRI